MVTQYAAHSDVIWGIGETRDAALAEAVNAGVDVTGMAVAEMTSALVRLVAANGGDCGATELADGRLGTNEERDAELAEVERVATMAADAVARSVERSTPECAAWLDERREMLTAMGRHLNCSGSHVRLSSRGLVHWAPGVPTLHDDQPARGGRLAHGRHAAAAEMRDNLGDDSWTRRILREESQMLQGRRDILARVGVALYGAEWISPLARDLSVAQRTAQRWAAGDVPVPLAVTMRDLPALVAAQGPRRLAEMRAAITTIEAFVGHPEKAQGRAGR